MIIPSVFLFIINQIRKLGKRKTPVKIAIFANTVTGKRRRMNP